MKIEWKKIGMGIFAAGLGAAVFGAVHYMFLQGNTPTGSFIGVPYTTWVPVLLGVLGFIGAYSLTKPGVVRDVVSFGSAAALGFGIATYIGWITPTSSSKASASMARASAPMARPLPAAVPANSPYASTSATVVQTTAAYNNSAVKLI